MSFETRNVTPIKRSAVTILATDLVDLLMRHGPLQGPEIRSRLGVASRERFNAAVLLAKGDGSIEQVSTSKNVVLRIKGDQRPVPETMTKFMEAVQAHDLLSAGARS